MQNSRAARVPSRTLVPLLLGALALTVVSFLLSAVVAELRARGIEDAADSIATNAMPSIEQLADMRSDLRLMEGLAIEYAHRVGAGEPAAYIPPESGASARAWPRGGRRSRPPPSTPASPILWVEIEAGMAAVDASLARVLAAVARRDPAVDALIYGSLRPDVDHLAEALLIDLQFNAQHAHALADQIAASRIRQRRVAAGLDGASALFALIAAVAVARLLHGYLAMTEARLTELDLFAARVAHDIRSPLMSVGLAIELARQKRVAEEAAQAVLDRAARSVQRVGQIVDALLGLAGASAAPEEGARAEVRTLAGDALAELGAAAREKGVDLGLDPFDPVEVCCSPGVLGGVLSNLIGNAIKYIGDGPEKRVRVAARAEGARVRIEVVDTGPGVPAHLRERIFDPYVRAASSSIPGFGLGLATVRRMVEARGGRVGVEAVPAGGSRFWVELPKAVDPPGGGAESGVLAGAARRRSGVSPTSAESPRRARMSGL